MEQRSLKVLDADKTFFTKISTTISKLLIPTKVGINGLLISMKRNNVLKAYEAYTASKDTEDAAKIEQDAQKYEETYSLYLESIDKYIMDSVYKKVKSGSASHFERDALSKYYTVVHLKDEEYVEYKHRKQKYLLELDYESLLLTGKEKIIDRYKSFYLTKIESLYKGILKNYSVQLSDAHRAKFHTNEEIYEKIFSTLEDYTTNVMPLKIERSKKELDKQLLEDYQKYERFEVGKLEKRDQVEKKLVLLAISRSLFTHSMPLVVADECYVKLIKEVRNLIVEAESDRKKEETYTLLLNVIEDYNVRLLSGKVYWDKPEEKDEYKKFWTNYENINKLKQKNYIEYMRQKEILFVRADLKKLRASKKDYSKIIDFYRQKLIENDDMRTVKNKYITLNGHYTKATSKA